MKEHSISVCTIIPVHNRKIITLNCLAQLNKIYKSFFELNIIIVDDGSTDGTSEAIRQAHKKVDIVHGDSNLWWTGSINRGINFALAEYKPDYIHLMNDDIAFDKNFLEALVVCAKESKNALLGSITLSADQRDIIVKAGMEVTGKVFNPLRGKYTGKALNEDIPDLIEADSLSGRSLLIPVEVIKNSGLLDEKRFPHNGGDHEFCARCKKKGIRLYSCKESRIYTKIDERKNLHYMLYALKRIEFTKTLFNLRYPWHLKTIFQVTRLYRSGIFGAVSGCFALINICKWAVVKLIIPHDTLARLLESKRPSS